MGAPTALAFDDAANEVYIADGLMNKRIVVYDMNTGEFKRGWGAYGIPLDQIDNSDPSAKELPTGRVEDASRFTSKAIQDCYRVLRSRTTGWCTSRIK